MRTLMLGLAMMMGTAEAAKLYTVTVRTSQAWPKMQIGLFNKDDKLAKKYTFYWQGTSHSWKVPAGKYAVFVYQDKPDIQAIDTTFVDVTVSKDSIFNVPQKLLPSITGGARQAWNRLLIDLQATVEERNTQTVGNSCAQTPGDAVTVRGFVALHPEWVQLSPWQSIGNGALGVFRIDGLRYQISLSHGDAGTFMGLGRL